MIAQFHETFSLSSGPALRVKRRSKDGSGIEQPTMSTTTLISSTPATLIYPSYPNGISPIAISPSAIHDELLPIARTVGTEYAKVAYASALLQSKILTFIIATFSFLLQLFEFGPAVTKELESLRVAILDSEINGIVTFNAATAMKKLNIEGTMTDAILMKIRRGVLDIWEIVQDKGGMTPYLRAVLVPEIGATFHAAWEDLEDKDFDSSSWWDR
ncbi:hypothetical protein HK102_000461 [Quaeritorhiza haematococci]|nr:hypothetical protein HK102_000461 [Quaeritorhiza haematococci]